MGCHVARGVFLAVVLLVVAGCATPPPVSDREATAEFIAENDPIEPVNRNIFAFNRQLDDAVLKPVARAYNEGVPLWVRIRVDSALDNLRSPVIFINDVLQGEIMRALTTLVRFAINTSVGLGGMHDIASEIGLPEHNEDFGQTLAVWGSDAGPYIMLPVLGPSNPRDAIGRVVDFIVDPFSIWTRNTGRDSLMLARSGSEAVETRAEILPLTDDLEKTSLDLYAATRSLYRQQRANAISNGAEKGPNVSSIAVDFPLWKADSEDKELSGTSR